MDLVQTLLTLIGIEGEEHDFRLDPREKKWTT
jgi:hypothetical protein